MTCEQWPNSMCPCASCWCHFSLGHISGFTFQKLKYFARTSSEHVMFVNLEDFCGLMWPWFSHICTLVLTHLLLVRLWSDNLIMLFCWLFTFCVLWVYCRRFFCGHLKIWNPPVGNHTGLFLNQETHFVTPAERKCLQLPDFENVVVSLTTFHECAIKQACLSLIVLFFLNANCKKKNKKIQVFVTAKRFYPAPDLQVLAKLVMGKKTIIL